jgi:S-formylglutathione hydrolase FrmB
MFAVAAFTDVKERKIHDIVWLVFGGTGAILYAFEPPDMMGMVSMIIGIGLASTFWFFRLYAGADALALISLSVILPTYHGIIVPLSMVLIATAISAIYGVVYNVAANSKTFLNNKKIFEEFDEPTYRKFAAFFLVHKRTKNEKFAFPAESSGSVTIPMMNFPKMKCTFHLQCL